MLYLNQTPNQPRERDYAYAGSFYAFSIWIGMGVAGLWSLVMWALKKKDKKPAKGEAAVAPVKENHGLATAIAAVAALIGILNAQDEGAAVVLGGKEGIQRRAQVAHVHITRGAGPSPCGTCRRWRATALTCAPST